VELSCSQPINQYCISKLSQILDHGSGNYRYYVGYQHLIGRADTGYVLIFIRFPLTQWSPLASHFLQLFSNLFEHFISMCALKTMQVFLPVVQTFAFYHLQHDTQGHAFHLRFWPLAHFPGQSFEQMSCPNPLEHAPVQHLTSEFMVKHDSLSKRLFPHSSMHLKFVRTIPVKHTCIFMKLIITWKLPASESSCLRTWSRYLLTKKT
jgi:hypothetical protein